MADFKQYGVGKDEFSQYKPNLTREDSGLSQTLREIEIGNMPAFFSRSSGKIILEEAVASDRLQARSDAQVTNATSTLTKVKEFRVYLDGTARVSFDMAQSTGTNQANGAVYVNGTQVGTSHSIGSATFSNFSDDIQIKRTDLVQLYINNTSGTGEAQAKNFHISYNIRTRRDNFDKTVE